MENRKLEFLKVGENTVVTANMIFKYRHQDLITEEHIGHLRKEAVRMLTGFVIDYVERANLMGHRKKTEKVKAAKKAKQHIMTGDQVCLMAVFQPCSQTWLNSCLIPPSKIGSKYYGYRFFKEKLQVNFAEITERNQVLPVASEGISQPSVSDYFTSSNSISVKGNKLSTKKDDTNKTALKEIINKSGPRISKRKNPKSKTSRTKFTKLNSADDNQTANSSDNKNSECRDSERSTFCLKDSNIEKYIVSKESNIEIETFPVFEESLGKEADSLVNKDENCKIKSNTTNHPCLKSENKTDKDHSSKHISKFCDEQISNSTEENSCDKKPKQKRKHFNFQRKRKLVHTQEENTESDNSNVKVKKTTNESCESDEEFKNEDIKSIKTESLQESDVSKKKKVPTATLR